jgi:hypothetical protein
MIKNINIKKILECSSLALDLPISSPLRQGGTNGFLRASCVARFVFLPNFIRTSGKRLLQWD